MKENGLFKDLRDFIDRMSGKEVNKKAVENFIMAGAFDGFNIKRSQMMAVYPGLMDTAARERKSRITGQMNLMDFLGGMSGDGGMFCGDNTADGAQSDGLHNSLGDAFSVSYPDIPEFSKEEMLSGEKEILGIYVSGHPLDDYRELLEKRTDAVTLDFFMDEETGKTGVMDNREYCLGGIIDAVNMKITKNNENMAFVTLLDTLGTLEVIVFPKTFEKCRRMIYAGSKVLIKGRAQVSEDEGKLIASEIISLDEALLSEKQKHTEVWILFEDGEDYKANEQNLSQLLMDYRGFSPVFVQLRQEKKGMKLRFSVDPESGVTDALKLEFGIDRVITRESKR